MILTQYDNAAAQIKTGIEAALSTSQKSDKVHKNTWRDSYDARDVYGLNNDITKK